MAPNENAKKCASYRALHVAEKREKDRARYAAKRDEISRARKVARLLARDKVNAMAREHNKKHPRTRYAKYAERMRAASRAWAKTHPEKAAARAANGRARRKMAHGSHSAAEWAFVLALHHGLCAYCNEPATTKDHVTPLKGHGDNTIDNVTPACRRCNSSKRNTPMLVWLTQRHA